MEKTSNMLTQQKKLDLLTLKKLAKQEIKLIDLNREHKKIKDYSTKEYLKLVQTILNLSKFIGITEPPDKDTLQMLAEFISEYWYDFSIPEIKFAFNKAIVLEKPVFTHYNRFTPQLLSTVLNSYKKERNKALIKYVNELDNVTSKSIRLIHITNDEGELKTLNEWGGNISFDSKK